MLKKQRRPRPWKRRFERAWKGKSPGFQTRVRLRKSAWWTCRWKSARCAQSARRARAFAFAAERNVNARVFERARWNNHHQQQHQQNKITQIQHNNATTTARTRWWQKCSYHYHTTSKGRMSPRGCIAGTPTHGGGCLPLVVGSGAAKRWYT